jgi:hypothetical protein
VIGGCKKCAKTKRAHAPIDWDQARDILIAWEQHLVNLLRGLVKACKGLIGLGGLMASFSMVGIKSFSEE